MRWLKGILTFIWTVNDMVTFRDLALRVWRACSLTSQRDFDASSRANHVADCTMSLGRNWGAEGFGLGYFLT